MCKVLRFYMKWYNTFKTQNSTTEWVQYKETRFATQILLPISFNPIPIYIVYMQHQHYLIYTGNPKLYIYEKIDAENSST